MSGWSIVPVLLYSAVTLALLLGSIGNYIILTVPELRRKAARMAFLAPFWPVVMVVLAVRGFKPMWRTAWGKQ